MKDDLRRRACAECGARLDADADACDLCGAPVAPPDRSEATASDPLPTSATSGTGAAPVPSEHDGVFCNQCGWQNPAGARFCSMCGAPLQAVGDAAGTPQGPRTVPVAADLPSPGRRARAHAAPPPAAPPPDDDRGGVSRQVGIVVGAGVLLVVALFLVTVLSKDVPAVSTPPTAIGAADGVAAASAGAEGALAPVAPEFAESVAALEAEIAAAEGAARTAKQRELVNLLIGIGRLDRAAYVQEEIARAEATPEAWTRAGNLFYDWADAIPDERQADRIAPARRAVAAYGRALELDPDNLDVRTDMAWVAQYDPETPMEAVVQTNRVLEENPDHVAANFNKGLLFLRINRLEQALAQFEKVQSLVDPTSPVYGQAEAAAQVVRDRLEAAS